MRLPRLLVGILDGARALAYEPKRNSKSASHQKVDYPFSQEAWQTLGYTSVRLAAIDALRQIGGAEAVAAMQELLGSTPLPREIAVPARDLEEASPGQYREQVLAAARTGLAAAGASMDPQLDVAPLFEVFQRYGDASVIPELEKAIGQWKYYATIALANLPDNAGVPSVLRLADPASGSGSRAVALEMVAQLAATNLTRVSPLLRRWPARPSRPTRGLI